MQLKRIKHQQKLAKPKVDFKKQLVKQVNQDRLTKKKERRQIINIRNKRGVVTTDLRNSKKLLKTHYYEQLYVHEVDSLDEMDQFLKDKICQNSRKKISSLYIYCIKKN